MTYMDQAIEVLAATQAGGTESGQASRKPTVLVVEDDEEYSTAFRAICDCLDVAVERMPSHDDLRRFSGTRQFSHYRVLRQRRGQQFAQ